MVISKKDRSSYPYSNSFIKFMFKVWRSILLIIAGVSILVIASIVLVVGMVLFGTLIKYLVEYSYIWPITVIFIYYSGIYLIIHFNSLLNKK